MSVQDILHPIGVGVEMTDSKLKELATKKGRRSFIDSRDDWIKLMDDAKGKWVVLETNSFDGTNNSRIRNRVTRMNKAKSRFEFTSRVINNTVLFLGRTR